MKQALWLTHTVAAALIALNGGFWGLKAQGAPAWLYLSACLVLGAWFGAVGVGVRTALNRRS